MKVLQKIGVVLALAVCAGPAFADAIRNARGFSAGTLPATDDGSTAAVPLGFSAFFFGASGNSVFVNNNGNVTFTTARAQYTPSGLSDGMGQPIIAPFFADVDTRGSNSGVVTYGTDTLTDGLLGWHDSSAFGVEWPNVGYYRSRSDRRNTFELILVSRSDIGNGDFDIEFNYNVIQWEAGVASNGTNGLGGTSAGVGYSNGLSGASNVFFQLDGSMVDGALIDGGPNALVSGGLGPDQLAGRYDFQVRSGSVVALTPEPASIALVVVGLLGAGVSRRRQGKGKRRRTVR